MKSTRHFVAVLIELSSGVENGHDNFQCGFLFLLLEVNRNSTAVVEHRDRSVLVDCHIDVLRKPCQGLVDRVVHHFVHEMVKPPYSHVPDIHRWAATDGFQPFEDCDVFRGVRMILDNGGFRLSLHVRVLSHSCIFSVYVLRGCVSPQNLRCYRKRISLITGAPALAFNLLMISMRRIESSDRQEALPT